MLDGADSALVTLYGAVGRIPEARKWGPRAEPEREDRSQSKKAEPKGKAKVRRGPTYTITVAL